MNREHPIAMMHRVPVEKQAGTDSRPGSLWPLWCRSCQGARRRGSGSRQPCQLAAAFAAHRTSLIQKVEDKIPAGTKLFLAQIVLLTSQESSLGAEIIVTSACRFIFQNSCGSNSRHTLFHRHLEEVVNSAGSALFKSCLVILIKSAT